MKRTQKKKRADGSSKVASLPWIVGLGGKKESLNMVPIETFSSKFFFLGRVAVVVETLNLTIKPNSTNV